MSNTVTIQPMTFFRATVRPPGSKSLTNRALLLAALAEGESVLRQSLIADDTRQMLGALQALGFDVVNDVEAEEIRVVGCGGRVPTRVGDTVSLHLGNAGTAYRFLTAACCLPSATDDGEPTRHVLDGIARMRERPIGQLVDALRRIGGQIDYVDKEGFPPIRVAGVGLRGGELEMPPTLSSQYISALLQVGPYCDEGLTVCFDGPVTSRPYVEMTLNLMSRFGVEANVDPAFTRVRIEPGRYRGTDYAVEPDASNASYFLAAAAITPGSQCTIQGLGKKSLQGDVCFADVLHQMGAGLLFGDDFITMMAPPDGQHLRGIDIDLNRMPDMAQTLAVVALFAQGDTTIRNVGNLRVKETDRIAALQAELVKFGAGVTVDGDDLTITPSSGIAGDMGTMTPRGAIDTYNDHRMAMSFAVAGLRIPGVVINDPGCVDKTFPAFFGYLSDLSNSG